MANEHHADLAVVSLAAYIRNGIAAKLRAIETEQGLDAGSLLDPAVVIEASAPLDNRNPRYEVYIEDGQAHPESGEIRKVHVWDVTVAYSYTGDADIEAGERMARKQYTALRRLIEADYKLGGTVVVAIPGAVEFGRSRGDDAATKHEFALGVEVHTHDP
jgi:hypothetical protein